MFGISNLRNIDPQPMAPYPSNSSSLEQLALKGLTVISLVHDCQADRSDQWLTMSRRYSWFVLPSVCLLAALLNSLINFYSDYFTLYSCRVIYFFVCSPFFFRQLPSELTKRNSTKLYHFVGICICQ